jgi:hypothetical protein
VKLRSVLRYSASEICDDFRAMYAIWLELDVDGGLIPVPSVLNRGKHTELSKAPLTFLKSLYSFGHAILYDSD